MKQTDFTRGSIARSLLAFTVPLMLGNVLQQCYNIADTLIVGRFLGKEALAAVGSAYTLMIFLTSVLTGLSMGSGAFLSVALGKNNTDELKTGNFMSLSIISAFTALMVVFVYIFINPLLHLLQTPAEGVFPLKSYLLVIFSGIPATFIYNYYASSLRAVGNSTVSLVFASFSCSFRPDERCARHCFCGDFRLGNQRSCRRDRGFPVRLRARNFDFHAEKRTSSKAGQGTFKV